MPESHHQDDSLIDPSSETGDMKGATPWTTGNIEKHVLKITRVPDSADSIICAANYEPYPHHLAICDVNIPDTEPMGIVDEIRVKLYPGNLDDIIPVFRRLAPMVLCERHNHPFERYLTRCRWTWNLAQEDWSVAGVLPSPESGYQMREEGRNEGNDEQRGTEKESAEEGSMGNEAADWEPWRRESSAFGYKQSRLRMWEDDLWRWQGELQTKEQIMRKRERALVRKEDRREREEMLRISEGTLQSWASSLRTREEWLGIKLEDMGSLERRRSGDKAGGLECEGWLLRLAYGWRESGLSMSNVRGSAWRYYLVTSFLTVGIWLVWSHL